jgi:hypothetical protein
MGHYKASDILKIFATLKDSGGKNCRSIVLHHIMGWNTNAIIQLIQRLKPVNSFFWIHDFYTVCPNHTLLRNDKEYCHAPSFESNSCLNCRYGAMRIKHQPQVYELLSTIKFTFLAASKFTIDNWVNSYPQFSRDVSVIPLLNLVNARAANIERSARKDKIRIAYVGFPIDYKGWSTWRKFVSLYRKSNVYDLFHFGNYGGNHKEHFIQVNVTSDNRYAMVEELRNNEVDILFHWTIVPETFSFVLYEGVAANCFILTHKDSGNVATYIQENDNGIVFGSEEQLFAFFKDADKVIQILSNFKINHNLYYDLSFNTFSTDMIYLDEKQPGI